MGLHISMSLNLTLCGLTDQFKNMNIDDYDEIRLDKDVVRYIADALWSGMYWKQKAQNISPSDMVGRIVDKKDKMWNSYKYLTNVLSEEH